MSQFPNNQSFYSGQPQQQSTNYPSTTHFNPGQLQQLSDFHQRQTQLLAQQRASNQSQGQTTLTREQLQAQIQLQQRVVAAQQLQQTNQQALNPHQPSLLASAAFISSKPPSPPRPSNTVRRPSIPITQAFVPSAQSLSSLNQSNSENRPASSSVAAAALKPRLRTLPPRAIEPNPVKAVNFGRTESVGFRESTPDVRDDNRGETDPRRRRDDGMRGSMRNEISRLMYACGDVNEPDADSVEYMEDLVVDFLADLCRPNPPIRMSTSSARVTIPLTAQTLRHRLSHPSMKKYLERFDHMTFMSVELQASRRVAMPSNQDLINMAGKEFLGLEDEVNPETGGGVVCGAVEKGRKKLGRRRKRIDGGVASVVNGRGESPASVPQERRKPGPKPGWKRRLIDGSEPPSKRMQQVKKERSGM